MAINKENEFLKMDEKMISIFNIRPIPGKKVARRDRGEEVNLFIFICSELGKAICEAKRHGEDLTHFTLEVPYKQIHQVLFERPVSGETVTVKKLMDVVEKINSLEGVTMMIYQDPKSKEKNIIYDGMQIYSRIQIEGQAKHYDKAVFKVKLCEDFIEYYKEVLSRKTNYFKLELDIAFSLTTKNSKIVYAYLSRYHDQMNKHWSTNPTGIDKLMFYLDNTVYSNGDEWVFKMNAEQLKNIVENALKEINEVIMMKREKYRVDIPIYDKEWIKVDPNATKGPKTRIKEVRFFYVDEGQKIDSNRLHYNKENSYDNVINKFTGDEDIKALLQQFVAEAYERNNIASVNTFEKVLNNMKEANLTKEKTMEFIQDSITEGSPSIKFTKESHEKVKAFKEKAEKVQAKKERSFDDFNIPFNTSNRRRMDGRK